MWDGSALAAEQDSDGTVHRYLWGPDRTPLSVAVEYSTGATETFSYHTDALGSVVAMTDESGSVVARYSYDPYGRCTAATGEEIATRNPLRYRAYYADAETGLFYLPARYYDPQTYRFLSRDPAAPSAGDPLSLNAYAYCLGDPVGASDPSGATTDYDGNGKLDTWDSAEESAAHAKSPYAKQYYHASAINHYYRAQLNRKLFDKAQSGQTADRGLGLKESKYIESSGYMMDLAYGAWTTGQLPFDPGLALFGWSDADVEALRTGVLDDAGSRVMVRTAFGFPSASVLLFASGFAQVVFGGCVVLAGAGIACTGIGVAPGAGGIVGGTSILVSGLGLMAAGATGMEAETGRDVVPWY